MALIDPNLIEQLGLTLLHFLWQGALIGTLYWLSLLIGRPTSAGTRYNLAVGTLIALGLTPLLTFLYLGSANAAGTSTLGSEGVAVMRLVISATGEEQAMTLLAWTVAGWLAGVLMLSLRLILGWHYITRLKRSARREALAHLTPALDRLRAKMAIRKTVALAVSDRIPSPVVVGWLKPLILFPPALVTRLSQDQIEMILAHELAHIRRHDHLVNLVQIVIETLLFYHPVVALVSRQIRIERENACDDLAVSSTRDRLAYVEMLASLERFRQPGPSLTLGLQDGQILGRIRRLVERSRPRRQLGITLPALLGLMLLAGSTGLWMMPDPDGEVLPSVQPNPSERPFVDSVASSRSLPSAPLFALPRSEPRQAESSNPSPEQATEAILANAADTSRAGAASSGPSASERPSPDVPADISQQITDLEEATASLETMAPARFSGTDGESSSGSTRASAIDSTDRGAAAMDSATDAGTNSASDPQPSPTSLSDLEAAMRQVAMAPAAPLTIENATPSAREQVALPELTGGDPVRQIEPAFPRKARRRGVNGVVELEFTVDQEGRVQDIGVIEERPGGYQFGEAATAAIEQWRFDPYRRGGDTVERQVRLAVEFDLAEACAVSTGSRLPRC